MKKFLRKLFLLGLTLAFLSSQTVGVFAQSANELRAIFSGTPYFDADSGQECAGVTNTLSIGRTSGQPLTGFDPLSLSYPAFPEEALVAQKITDYLKERKPNTPWLGIDTNFGSWLLSESKTRNINPMLVMTMGRQENGFGTSDRVHVRDYHNYFGMKGSTPIDIPNSDYRGFNSPTEGMRFMLDRIMNNTQGSDRGRYAEVVNYYEYQSVHQVGHIVYPGEPFGTKGPTGQDDLDPTMNVYVSWTTTDHPNDAYDGNLYNPGIYYTNAIELINTLLGTSLSDVPVKSGGGGAMSCLSGGGRGITDTSGYSFPLAPQTRAVGGITVGQTTTRHGDGTPAFDLFSPEGSAAVYAIYSGKATNIKTDFNGIPGCSTIMFLADDGFYYWYGHLKNVIISQGTPITSGQQIAQIADKQNFGSDCWGGGPHLHIDRGCVINGKPQTGGRDECRDPDFIPFLSSIYERLPAR